MAWFADLSHCDYFGEEYSSSLRAVGWLEQGRPFAQGKVDPEIYRRLVELFKEPWEPTLAMGFHRCDLCLYQGETGASNLLVPADEIVYFCPELVVHYMNAHGYQPPDDFCRSVLSCPAMKTMPYFKALLKRGVKPLIQHSRVLRSVATAS